jgi:hypothetical protein
MVFTKHHYTILSKVISHSSSMDDLINQLCTQLSIDNPRFNEDKFREACNGHKSK